MEVSVYDVKMIIFGNYFEVYKYQKPQLKNFKKNKIVKCEKMEKNTKRFAYSLNRTRNTVRRLVSANFQNRDSFLTLTFEENLEDVRIANTCFKQFVRFIRHWIISQGDFPIEQFKYLAVIEFQKRGAVHYHVLMHVPFIPQEILKIAWPYGFFKINVTNHVENIGAYVSKYMEKDIADPKLRGKRAYQTSRNLIRPFEITDKEIVRTVLSSINKKETFVKKGIFDNQYTGKVYYRQYKRPFGSVLGSA